MRIGVIGNEGSWYVDRLCAAGRARNHFMAPLSFQAFRIDTRSDQLHMRCAELSVHDFDAILVRTMPPGSLEQVVSRMDILNGAARLGVHIVNSPRAIECAVDKYLTTQRLALAGLPVPDTTVCESADQAMEAFHDLGRDVVVKPLFGAEGRGITRITEAEFGWRVFRTLERMGAVLYVQQFLAAAPEDIRILLLDGEVIGSMKRTAAAGDFRANAAQSATCQPWTPTEHEVHLARQAAQVTDCHFCGIDLMYDPSGQPRIIEVNAVPGWKSLEKTCHISVTDKLFAWLESHHHTSSRSPGRA